MKILIIGTGYVGTTTGLIFCEMGHQVTGLDLDDNKIQLLNAGTLHFYEPGLEEVLQKHVAAQKIHFTKRTKEAIQKNDLIFICVGTPQGENGTCDLSYVEQVSRSIGKYMNQYKIIVTKSTVPVGTASSIVNWIEDSQAVPLPFDVVSNPEFLREGSALQDAIQPDRIVIGLSSERARTIMKELYKDFHCPIIETSPQASEMIKYAANSYLAMKISYINELARLCDILQINVNDVAQGIGLDHRIGPHFLQAGMGYGGSCFPKDVSALLQIARENGNALTILESVVRVNEEQPQYIIEKMKDQMGGNLKDKTIAVLGLAFKANTDDTRESPSLALINRLINEGVRVKVHDPVVRLGSSVLMQCDTVAETITNADALVIGTDWSQYKGLDWEELKLLMNRPVVIDGRNMLDKRFLEEIGYSYIGVANY